ncbi:hypothetical protein [Cohnella herbarum]|uniref:Uncharacterized protein n=1 Tax=Cohnella herbarum TaxID=2728023 RepID=A0A7Z2VGU2_9BACL|nr:hypothetical protein [Cohnella herbarum]QJD82946.1 hypothetical protein HH215_07000 [Cohnella herbarum]
MIKKEKLPAKASIRRVGVKVVNPLLRLSTGTNFTGTTKSYRGNLGIRNLANVGLNNNIQSLRLTTAAGATGTVVLFDGTGYSGDFVKFNPSAAGVPDLADFNFDNQASSLVVTSLVLSDADIAVIQQSGLSNNFGEILRRIRVARIRRAASRRGKK